ncbi:MAG TPA: beta-propeller domain-containing protein, partial [Jiangellaceae bacterium]
DARQVGSVARVVLRSGPNLAWTYPSETRSEGDALRANRDTLAGSTIEDWLPHYVRSEAGDRTEGQLVDCADVSHPRRYSGTSMLTVLTVDLDAGLQADNSIAVVADGQTVYGTGSSLYIADDHRGLPMPVDMSISPAAPGGAATEIHKFDVSGSGKPHYVATGEVDGWLLNQYSLSEYDGHLRVATTHDSLAPNATTPQAPPTESQVTVLAEEDGQLTKVGSVGGLGKGEQIYAVRFIGPVGYVVTFRQVDPLYTLDLSDPQSPRVVGELKIPGYSSYLHPAGDGRLIGIGLDSDAQGRIRGSQLSLFDVSDPGAPVRLDMLPIRGWSDAEYDPHAFLYWPEKGLLVIPVWWEDSVVAAEPAPTDTKPFAPAGGALVLRVEGDSLAEVGALTHVRSSGATSDYRADPTVRRSLVIGETLWTLSPSGALASDLDDLAEQAWVPFTS